MGKPYAAELAKFGDTYAWALNAPIEPLAAALSASSNLPLLAVGSGGSYSVAHFASALHERHTGLISKPVTPLEFVTGTTRLRSASTLFLSAGGSNADIISGLENAIRREPRRCIVLCFRKDSKLSQVARKFRYVDLIELTPPAGKDGFLATNSLLAFTVLLERAYASAFCLKTALPSSLERLLGETGGDQWKVNATLDQCAPLWERETLLVLYGPSVSSAAVDLESKFSEAALGNVQLADFRNFAHGRHHWLAKRGTSSAVLTLFAQNEESMAEKTSRLIPPSVPVAKIRIPAVGTAAAVGGMLMVLHLVGAAGRQQDVDPGRPGVPSFGRRIYGLRMLGGFNKTPVLEDTAISRKLGLDAGELKERGDILFWRKAYQEFTSRLASATFGAVLLDYDGTMCDEPERFSGLRSDVSEALQGLLTKGIVVGLATGRGDSVRADLRRALPESLWSGVYLGYYNGCDIGRLNDDSHPDSSGPVPKRMKVILRAVERHPIISTIATWKTNQYQMSLRATSARDRDLLWGLAQHLVRAAGLQAVRSSHSIDILQPRASKRALLRPITERLKSGVEVLCIGDKGQWPGNDYELLGEAFSLSVDDVSGDPGTCWNIARPGQRGAQALVEYLEWVNIGDGGFSLTLPTARNLR